MTPSELKDLLYEYDEGRVRDEDTARDIYLFGVWWWRDHLSEAQRSQIRFTDQSVWEDLRRLPDEELMFLWAAFKM